MWALDSLLENALFSQGFDALRRQASEGVMVRQVEIFESLLGCLGIKSNRQGIRHRNNWCSVESDVSEASRKLGPLMRQPSRMVDSAAHLVNEVFPKRPIITYRLAFGPNAGKKALTLQAVPVSDGQARPTELVSKQADFSLHAGVAGKSNQRKKLERLCRYVTRPAIAEQRLSLAGNGNVVVALKTPYDDGTSHVVLTPMEFMGRLATLVPKLRVNLTRFHGVFSSNSKLREFVVPTRPAGVEHQSDKPRSTAYSMRWSKRLKRVFVGAAIRIEIEKCEKCEKCGGKVKVIACIEDPEVIEKILKHLGLDETSEARIRSPPTGLFVYSGQLF